MEKKQHSEWCSFSSVWWPNMTKLSIVDVDAVEFRFDEFMRIDTSV